MLSHSMRKNMSRRPFACKVHGRDGSTLVSHKPYSTPQIAPHALDNSIVALLRSDIEPRVEGYLDVDRGLLCTAKDVHHALVFGS